MRFTATIVLCALFLGMPAGALGQVTPEQERWLKEAWEESKWIDFTVAGEIVDQDGARVPDVNLIIRSKAKGGGEPQNTVSIADGTFRILRKDSRFLEFFVFKEGYFDERVVFFPTNRDGAWGRQAMRGEKPKPGKYVDEDVRIVLEKHGPLAVLRQRHAQLEVEPAGQGQIMDLTRYGGIRLKVADWEDVSKFPEHSIYMLAETDEHGKFAGEMVVDKWGKTVWVPKRVRIIMKGEGGFVRVPLVGHRTQQHRSMKEAPAEGYATEMTLDARQLLEHNTLEIDGNTEEDYFYFKTANGYGKGSFRFLWQRDGSKISASLRLLVQEDGSRLVATSE